MIIHRQTNNDFRAYQVAVAMDEMGHTVVSVVCRTPQGSGLCGPMDDVWHIFSQGPEISTSELDKLIG